MNSKYIVKLLLKNKLNVLIILVLAVLLALMFSSKTFIKPLYKSSVILYPTTTYSASKLIMNTNTLIYTDPLEIGDEEATDHMIQILNSGIIRDKIIEKYDLMNHYGISNDCEYKYTKLIKAYENNIRIRRTEYNSVKIIVFDTDPEIASNIANDLASMFDETMNGMLHEIAAKALEIVEREYNNTLNEINALSQNGESNNISNDIQIKKDYLSLLKSKYYDARLNATETIPHKMVITNAYISDKPVYPIRWVIVTVTFFATLIMIIMVLAALEYSENKNNKQDE